MIEIEYKNINKKYNQELFAVANANFNVKKGEFLVLVGPSGCGKSTILRMTAGLEEITSGEIYFDGKLINDVAPKDRRIGMVFQNYALYPHLTVFENIAFPLKIAKESKQNIKKRVDEIAQIVDLADYLNRKPKELSGGQRQRVALGRAIARKPDVFLFDEPLSNLDAKLRVMMRTEIINLQRNIGATSIYVTHDQTEAMTMGDRLVVMKDGIIQQIASPAELYNQPDNIFVAGFIGSPQMNFFEGKIVLDNGIKFIENKSGNVFQLSESNFRTKAKEQNATLGIRPEKIMISNEMDINTFSTRITNIEYLGFESIIYFKTDDKAKCLRTIAEISNKTGDEILIKSEQNSIIIFDSNGQRL